MAAPDRAVAGSWRRGRRARVALAQNENHVVRDLEIGERLFERIRIAARGAEQPAVAVSAAE